MDTTFTSGTTITSSWLNNVNRKIYFNEVLASSYGAVGDGTADDLASILAALGALLLKGGGLVRLESGKSYRVSAAIPLGSFPNCGIVGDGTPEIFAPASSFNNTNLATKYTSTSCVISVIGGLVSPFTPAKNNTIVGIKIRSEVSDGRAVDAIASRNAENLIVCSNEIYGFPVGCGLRASTLSGRCLVAFNHIYSFTTAAAWPSQPQISGIEIDGDRVNNTGSRGVWITHNRIRDLTMTGSALSTYGFQTDGINLQGTRPAPTLLCNVSDNIITNVGEGIDCFGLYNTFNGNIMRDIYDYGYKFIHGASFNDVTGGNLTEIGRAGIVVAGSGISGVGDTDRNSFSNVTIVSINPNNRAIGNPACFAIEDNVGTAGKVRNTIVNGGTWAMGTYGQYGLCDVSTGNGNIFTDVAMFEGAGVAGYIRSDNQASVVRLAGSSGYRSNDSPATIASDGSITPIADTVFVSGTSAITNINVQTRHRRGGMITLIPTGAWTTTTAGNIAVASTAVVGKALHFTYSPSTSKWYPSY